MNPYDVAPGDETPDDLPIDMAAVAADDARVEQLRRSLSPQDAVVWDDDDDELDPAFALLRVLQHDVVADLPAAAALLPAGVTALVPRQRRFGRTATIAAVTAGVLSIGGVAAAASSPGSPLGGVRSAVTSAVISVVHAITPDSPLGPTTQAHPASRSTVTPSPRGENAGDAVGSASAQVAVELDRAARLLGQGEYAAAATRLDAAGRMLPLVLDAGTHDRLAARLAALRALVAAPHPRSTPSRSSEDANAQGSHGSTTHDSQGSSSDSTGRTSEGGSNKDSGSSSDNRSKKDNGSSSDHRSKKGNGSSADNGSGQGNSGSGDSRGPSGHPGRVDPTHTSTTGGGPVTTGSDTSEHGVRHPATSTATEPGDLGSGGSKSGS